MAAYGAATSLRNTIKCILLSSRISLVPPSPQILISAFKAILCVQTVFLKLEGTGYSKIRAKVNALDERIKDAIWEFEDLLESHFYDQILPQLESSSISERDHLSFSVDLQSLQQSLDCLVERLTAMEVEYNNELLNMPEEEGEPISSRIDFCGINSEMVGLSDQFAQVKDDLLAEDKGIWLSVVGMAGVGKTTLAKKAFDDPSIQRHFELRAWVKVGRKCKSNEVLRCILAQVDPNARDQMLSQGDDVDDEKLVGLLEERWKDKKCLIVLDDVWDIKHLIRVMDNLPQENVRILLTSRLGIDLFSFVKVRLLDGEESKKLLGEKVFGEKGFPPHLEELGKKIAQKCEGLPLMIVTVADFLSQEDKTTECWAEVVEKQHNSIFADAYDHIYEVLFPSYDYLPQDIKMFFLYMGAFPPYTDIGLSYLFYLLTAEGFLEPMGSPNLEDYMFNCIVKLADWYHLILYEPIQHSWFLKNKFHVHSCWQHLCKKEASKIKFLHVLESWEDVVKDQRRLCSHCNTLFAFKEVCDSIKSDCTTTARSLLCYGPNHHYPVPIHDMGFKLLRVLDVVKVRFYHIPLEILKLVCLKYLALTCNKDLPVSISNLFQLQFLNIHLSINIKKRGASSYIPVGIWDMQELQHIEIMLRDLPAPPNSDATLKKLSFLFGVSVKSCTREILKRIPNLRTLGIVMELKPYADDDDGNLLSGLGYISEELQNLKVFSYMVVNPEMKYEFTIPVSTFPSSLIELDLSGLGCPWKHMNDIGSLLPNLMNLKLEHYAFRGSEWNIKSECFLKLETLVIEDTDLVRWRAQHRSLPCLSS